MVFKTLERTSNSNSMEKKYLRCAPDGTTTSCVHMLQFVIPIHDSMSDKHSDGKSTLLNLSKSQCSSYSG